MKFAKPRISSGNRGCGTPGVRGSEKIRTSAAVCFLLLLAPALAAETTAQAALSSALRTTGAVGVVLDVNTGRLVAAVNPTDAARSPGSILKPLFLAAALNQHQVLPQTTVFCRRDLRISTGSREWNLACTHPQTDVAFTAQEALAYSCNRYFAALADRMTPAQGSGNPRTLRSRAHSDAADPGAERVAGSGLGRNRRFSQPDSLRLSQAGTRTRRSAGPHLGRSTRGTQGFSPLRNGSQRRRPGHGDRRQDRNGE